MICISFISNILKISLTHDFSQTKGNLFIYVSYLLLYNKPPQQLFFPLISLDGWVVPLLVLFGFPYEEPSRGLAALEGSYLVVGAGWWLGCLDFHLSDCIIQ